MTKTFIFLFLFHFLTFTSKGANDNSFFVDIPDNIITAVRSGNSKEIAKYFNVKVDLKINNIEGFFSKVQAEQHLKEFFEKQPVKSFNITHKSTSNNGSMYVIGTIETTNGKYRTYFLLKTENDKTFIHQFRIEVEN